MFGSMARQLVQFMLLWLCRCNPSQQRARERKNPIRQGAKITINLVKYFAVCLGGFQLRRLNRAYGFIIWGYLFHILFFLSPRVKCVTRRTLVPAPESEVLSYIFAGWENIGEASSSNRQARGTEGSSHIALKTGPHFPSLWMFRGRLRSFVGLVGQHPLRISTR